MNKSGFSNTRNLSWGRQNMSNATLQLLDGHVSENEMYSLHEIKRRLGLGAHAIRTARKRGLRVLRIGRNDFILGTDLIRYAVETEDAEETEDK